MVPFNSVNVQGVGAVNADQLNTYVQTVANLNALRNFPGVGQMQIALQGYTTTGDSGAGFYVWSANATGPDNGTTVIVPNGLAAGAWLRLAFGGGGPISRCITYVVDGGGSVLPVGPVGDLYLPFAVTLTAVTLLADQIGNVSVDIYLNSLANYPPNSSNTIFPTDFRTLTNTDHNQDLAAGTDWITAFAAGDTLRFVIQEASIDRLTIALSVMG